ncbi:hypothetical protein ACFOQM_22660 [Paenibacillus sp. GCM10012307]|uniref:Uncharacterized protein n=1 Tax=Paenibacillus roseus TaxID=2798579 RepID=A0A934MR98_9BACL|nr:hypothetical protein [Paenibacillus roseus]MBJ6364031.1 hypothetical protein [Paenibacillus roseus]
MAFAWFLHHQVHAPLSDFLFLSNPRHNIIILGITAMDTGIIYLFYFIMKTIALFVSNDYFSQLYIGEIALINNAVPAIKRIRHYFQANKIALLLRSADDG